MSGTKKVFDDAPDEETVARNMLSFSGDIYSASDVKRFLEIATLNKVMSCRFVSWLCALRIVEGDRVKWMPDIMRSITYYDRCVKRYFKDSYYNPLSNLANGPLVRSSVEKSMEFFKKMALSEAYINEEIFSDAELRITRAIATSLIDNEGYKFEEGDERIFMIAYSVALGFARRGTLTNYFAECFAFHISNVLISTLSSHRKIMSLQVDDDFTRSFIHLMERFSIKTLKFMKKEGIDQVAICRRCVTTMFTENFIGDDLFLIFDNLILNLRDYRNYTNYMVVAMFRQIEERGGRYETEAIIPDQPLSAVSVLDDIYAMENTKEVNFFKMFVDTACPCINGMSMLFGTGKMF